MKSLFLVMRWGKGRETRGDEPKERSPGHAHPDEEERRVLMMPGSVGVGLWCGGCGDHGGACQGRREKKTKKPAKHSKKAGGYNSHCGAFLLLLGAVYAPLCTRGCVYVYKKGARFFLLPATQKSTKRRALYQRGTLFLLLAAAATGVSDCTGSSLLLLPAAAAFRFIFQACLST